MTDIENNKPTSMVISTTITFYEEPPKSGTWGSSDIRYEIYYNTKDGKMQIFEVGAFGDATLVAQYQDRRGRKITLDEMLENIQEISEMTYKEFKTKILNEG